MTKHDFASRASKLEVEFAEMVTLDVKTDSSAARGIVMRNGAGKVKHLSVKQLWVQEMESQKRLIVSKIPRETNFVDLFTHHWSRMEGTWMMAGISLSASARGTV